MNTTVKEIAKALGISSSTVSRALNDSPKVKKTTKEKVLNIAKEMGYQANLVARALATKKNYLLGLFVSTNLSSFLFSFLSETTNGILDEAARCGYMLTLIRNNVSEKIFSILSSRIFEGIIVLSAEEDDLDNIIELSRHNVPLVVVNRDVSWLGINSVVADEIKGTYEAVCFLAKKGHSRIGFLNTPIKYITSSRKLEGYKKALNDFKIDFRESYVLSVGLDEASGYEGTEILLEKEKDITAIFTANDLLAYGCLLALKKRNIKVPEDIAVIGFDNREFTMYSDPPLTTVEKPRYQMGCVAVDILFKIMDGEKALHTITLDTKLIVRNSA